MKYAEYMAILNSYLIKNRGKIGALIEKFTKSNEAYRLIKPTEEFYIKLDKKRENESTKNIGFPFPLYKENSLNYSHLINKGISIRFYFGGIQIRNKQRQDLIKNLSTNNNFKIKKINSLKKFRQITETIIKKHKKFSYVDPFTFLGDSIISTYYLQNFIKRFNLQLTKIYSHWSKNLCLGPEVNSIENINQKNSNLMIIGDFIDTHFNKTIKLINKLIKKKIDIILLGRNIIIKKDINFLELYIYNKPEHLLKNQNIEDYMDKILEPFLSPSKFNTKIKPFYNDSLNVMINPFGSEKIKTIPQSVIIKAIETIKSVSPNCNITLIKGTNKNHGDYIKSLEKKLNADTRITNIKFKKYSSLSDIRNDIIKKDISIGITADTSISHLFNYLGVLNITIFNSKRWDQKSIQSLSSDSPLGFCRYGETQIPLILRSETTCCKCINELILYLLGPKTIKNYNYIKLIDKLDKSKKKNTKKLILEISKEFNRLTLNKAWIKDCFNPLEITNEIKKFKEGKNLVVASWKLSPLYKIRSQLK